MALGSATACLESILRFLGIGAGNEVITSAYTYTASASPAVHVGATLKFIDVAPDSFEMDYEALEAAITEKTKVIVPVDIAGVPCDSYPRSGAYPWNVAAFPISSTALCIASMIAGASGCVTSPIPSLMISLSGLAS